MAHGGLGSLFFRQAGVAAFHERSNAGQARRRHDPATVGDLLEEIPRGQDLHLGKQLLFADVRGRGRDVTGGCHGRVDAVAAHEELHPGLVEGRLQVGGDRRQRQQEGQRRHHQAAMPADGGGCGAKAARHAVLRQRLRVGWLVEVEAHVGTSSGALWSVSTVPRRRPPEVAIACLACNAMFAWCRRL